MPYPEIGISPNTLRRSWFTGMIVSFCLLRAASAQGPFYLDVSGTHLPAGLEGPTLDGAVGDVDGDGDLDIAVAVENDNNTILLNDGSGKFTHTGTSRLMERRRDSEDVNMADFDGDGDLDILFVTETGQTNELYLNDGRGYFRDATDRLPTHGNSNGVLVHDVDGDGDTDMLIGNDGQDLLLLNDGAAHFTDATAQRLPQVNDVTQDLFLADVDGDDDLDLLAANETGRPYGNRLALNDGKGVFTDASDRLPEALASETSREVVAADLDKDGDMDIVTFNLGPRAGGGGRSPQDRLLLNDGKGVFIDATDRLPADPFYSWDGALVDLDADGDLDIVSCAIEYPASGGERRPAPYQAWLNDGTARFSNETARIFPASAVGFGWDVEVADFNGDGNQDLYFSAKNGPNGLLFGTSAVPVARSAAPMADGVPAPARPISIKALTSAMVRGRAPHLSILSWIRGGAGFDVRGRRVHAADACPVDGCLHKAQRMP